LGGNLGAKLPIGQPQVDEGEVRLVTQAEHDPLGDGAGDSAHLVAALDQDLLDRIGDHQVVLGDQDLEHVPSFLTALGATYVNSVRAEPQIAHRSGLITEPSRAAASRGRPRRFTRSSSTSCDSHST
jgi:hypothetical protein